MEPTRTISPEDLLSHLAWARALARRLVNDDATADDVLQESVAAALRRPPASDRPLEPWLGRVVRNIVRQRARGERRRADRERGAAAREALPSALELSGKAEAQRRLIGALLELDETSRGIVLLRYFEDLSSAEIARRTGHPAGTVRSRLKRAIDELRSKLDAQHGGDREAWRAALLPLGLAPTAARSAGAVGAAAVALKVAAVLAAALLIAVSLRSLLGAEGTERQVPVDVALPSPANSAPATPAERVAKVPAGGLGRTREPVDVTEGTADASASAAGHGEVRVRFVDGRGAPVAGVRAASHSVPPVASDADGRAALQVWFGARRSSASIEFRGPRIASDVVTAAGRRGETIDLGDVVVHPGGTIEGVVVDPAGRALAGVPVRVLGRERRSTTAGGMQVGSYTRLGAVQATSDAAGRFQLEGVLTGEVRVVVDDVHHRLDGESESVLVAAGRVTGDVAVVALPVDPDTLIEGIVLGPNGEPVPYVMVNARWRKWLSGGSAGSGTDAEGRFRLAVAARAKADLRVELEAPALARARLRGVRGGARDVVLRLAVPDRLAVEVVDSGGSPVAGARVELRSSDEARTGDDAGVEGLYRVSVPSGRFRAHVYADGFAEAVLGPFDPDALPESTRVVLESVPQLTGTVVSAGRPAAGARVIARAVASEKVLYAGLPSLVDPSPLAETRADAGGRFALTIRERARIVVRVESEGAAPFEWSPVDYRPTSGLDLGTAELGPGGALEGVVLDGDAIDQRHVVLASRGDGTAQSVRAEPDGSYRFTGLVPGPWMVRVVPELVPSEGARTSSTTGRPYRAFGADAFVAEARTTRFDPVIGTLRPRASVRGTLTLEGCDVSRFSVELIPWDVDASNWTMVQSQRVAADGAFEVEGGSAGRYVLLFVDRRAEGEEGLRILRELELATGETRVAVRASMGTVTVGRAASTVAERLLWRGADRTFALARVPEPGERQPFPAGVVQRVGFEAIAVSDLDAIDVVEEGWLSAGGELALGQE